MRVKLGLWALVAALLAAICGRVPGLAEGVPPTSVTLGDQKVIRVPLGATYALTPVFSPEGATGSCTWKSSDRHVATVKDGVVTPKRAGAVKITVTTDNKKKASVKLRVYDPTLPKSVRLDAKGTVKLAVGDRLTLTPTLSPDTARSGFKWKSSKARVAAVKKGVVTAKKPGTAKITVTTRNGKRASVRIKVVKRVYVASIADLSGGSDERWDPIISPVLPKGGSPAGDSPVIDLAAIPEDYALPYIVYACKDSHTIAILAKGEGGAWDRVLRLFPTGMGRNNVTDVGAFTLEKKERWHQWGSGYSPYANKLSVGIYLHGPIYTQKNHHTIRVSYYNVIGTDCSSGCLRTVCGCAAWVYYNCPVGTLVLVAQDSRFATPRPAKLSDNATTDPTDPGNAPEILITDFSLSPQAMVLSPGQAQVLFPANIAPANATTYAFSFTSSDQDIAIVSQGGSVTALRPGSAVITVRANDDFGCTASIPVTVVETPAFEMGMDDAHDAESPGLFAEEDALTAEEIEPVPEEQFDIEFNETDSLPSPLETMSSTQLINSPHIPQISP